MKHSSNKGQHTKDTSFIEERFHLKKKSVSVPHFKEIRQRVWDKLV